MICLPIIRRLQMLGKKSIQDDPLKVGLSNVIFSSKLVTQNDKKSAIKSTNFLNVIILMSLFTTTLSMLVKTLLFLFLAILRLECKKRWVIWPQLNKDFAYGQKNNLDLMSDAAKVKLGCVTSAHS